MAQPNHRDDLQGEDLETWSMLATMLEWLPPALDSGLREADLTHFEYGILYALSRADDRALRMSVLAGFANSSLSRLSRAATRLESKGWMRRSPDPVDGRFTLAHLTEAGERKVGEATPGHVRAVHELVLDRLTVAQKRQLREISRRVLRGISEDSAWEPPASS